MFLKQSKDSCVFSVSCNPHIKLCQHLWECSLPSSWVWLLKQDVQEEKDVGQSAPPLQACVFSIAWVISVSGSTVAKQAWSVFIYHTMAVQGIWSSVMNWPTCCRGGMPVQVSKCVGPHSRLVGFCSLLAVSDQLVPEFGNSFYTHDSVTKVIQETACRVVAVFGIKNWHPYWSVGLELLPAAVVTCHCWIWQ